jgi:SAM-dependent methyltransferase
MKGFFRRAYSSVRRQGTFATLVKIYGIALDHLFDFRYGIDTCSTSLLESLTINSDSRSQGMNYQPTRLMPFRRLLNELKPAIPPGAALVDFGSGKGRVLLIAAEFGFRKVVGVEFARELCELAKENCSRYKARTGVATEFVNVESDATKYHVNADECVFVLFNPFPGEILNTVLDNIVHSLQEHPRRILIIYQSPEWKHVIEDRPEFEPYGDFSYWGFDFAVFTSRGAGV